MLYWHTKEALEAFAGFIQVLRCLNQSYDHLDLLSAALAHCPPLGLIDLELNQPGRHAARERVGNLRLMAVAECNNLDATRSALTRGNPNRASVSIVLLLSFCVRVCVANHQATDHRACD